MLTTPLKTGMSICIDAFMIRDLFRFRLLIPHIALEQPQLLMRCACFLYLLFSFYFVSYFHHNKWGVGMGGPLSVTTSSKIDMKNVKSNYNIRFGFEFALPEGSEMTMDNVEASYNGDYGMNLVAKDYTGDDTAKVSFKFKGINSFVGNGDDGLQVAAVLGSGYGKSSVIVSKRAELNAYNNSSDGLNLESPITTLTVKKGGAVNACGNNGNDIVGSGDAVDDQFFPDNGAHYSCGSVSNTNADNFACGNTCPVCDDEE